MKKYIYSLFAAVLFLFSAGCSKDDDGSKNIDSGVVGEWHQTKWSNEAYADFDVYVEFLSDGTFNIFQKVFVYSLSWRPVSSFSDPIRINAKAA